MVSGQRWLAFLLLVGMAIAYRSIVYRLLDGFFGHRDAAKRARNGRRRGSSK